MKIGCPTQYQVPQINVSKNYLVLIYKKYSPKVPKLSCIVYLFLLAIQKYKKIGKVQRKVVGYKFSNFKRLKKRLA